jgi:hypothetical protein
LQDGKPSAASPSICRSRHDLSRSRQIEGLDPRLRSPTAQFAAETSRAVVLLVFIAVATSFAGGGGQSRAGPRRTCPARRLL